MRSRLRCLRSFDRGGSWQTTGYAITAAPVRRIRCMCCPSRNQPYNLIFGSKRKEEVQKKEEKKISGMTRACQEISLAPKLDVRASKNSRKNRALVRNCRKRRCSHRIWCSGSLFRTTQKSWEQKKGTTGGTDLELLLVKHALTLYG